MMIPFSGINHEREPELEAFNFWHSQIRITIERCFGVFIRRWGIFAKANRYDLSFFFEIVHAAGRLHNLCINWNTPLEAAICDSARVDDLGRLIAPEWQLESGFDSVINHQTGSTLREHLVQMLQNTPSLHVIRSHHQ